MPNNTAAAIAKLTKQGRIVMEAIGAGHVGFFDQGVTAGSGSWGSVLAPEVGVKAGVLTGLVKQGLMTTYADPESDEGNWYDLTALGADVANTLAAVEVTEVETKPLTRKQCVARLREAGYTGPTSYLMPKLRGIVAQHAA